MAHREFDLVNRTERRLMSADDIGERRIAVA
jgi:hypothetical protein